MDPIGPMPSVAHSFIHARYISCCSSIFPALTFFCFAGRYIFQVGTWTSQPVNGHLFQQQESQSPKPMSLEHTSMVMADLLSGWGPAEYEMALRVRVQAGDVRSFTTEAALHS